MLHTAECSFGTTERFSSNIIQVAEADVLRDERGSFGRKLDEAGVSVTTIRTTGTIHDFGF